MRRHRLGAQFAYSLCFSVCDAEVGDSELGEMLWARVSRLTVALLAALAVTLQTSPRPALLNARPHAA